ncbi:MAG: radical SAM protein [Thermodesulfobacteriota bacterium]|nr:radical SAM protein [Thermodesulfobacteriota bacterium]
MGYKYVFGPVDSSRLGLSLGLDLLFDKICSFDCIYCEVGRTKILTCERKPYVPTNDLLRELKAWKNKMRQVPDYVTLGGRGEPCLNSGLGEILAGVKEIFPDTPTAVLTNSSLLFEPQVREELSLADAVLPSLDTLVPDEFKRLNRPHQGIDVETLRSGLLKFRSGYGGRLFLEVLLVAGINDTKENLSRLREFCLELKPDRVDVVTMTRPGAFAKAKPVGQDTLRRWRKALSQGPVFGRAGPEVPRKERRKGGEASYVEPEALRDMIENSVSRRPQTAQMLAQALAAPLEEVQAALDDLAGQGKIKPQPSEREIFYASFKTKK